MNRRDFLSLKPDRGKETLELSCERLCTCCIDERTTRRLFDNLDKVLRGVDILRVMDREGLSSEEFSLEFEALLTSFRGRGGRVEFSESFAR